MVDLPRIPDDLIQQLRGIFFAKDRSPILSPNNWMGLPLLESAPSVNPSVSNYYFYFKTDGGLYRLDWDGNEIQVNGLDSLPVHTHADNNEGGIIPLDNTTVSKLRESDDGADALIADGSGYLASVSQPLFSAYNSANDANVTGDGTFYTVIFDTELYDVGGNYNNATGIFTAPVTGKYLIITNILISNLGAAHTGLYAPIVSSNRTYFAPYVDPYACSTGGFFTFQNIKIVDADAADTIEAQVRVSGGAKTITVAGFAGPNVFTCFEGYLLI